MKVNVFVLLKTLMMLLLFCLLLSGPVPAAREGGEATTAAGASVNTRVGTVVEGGDPDMGELLMFAGV